MRGGKRFNQTVNFHTRSFLPARFPCQFFSINPELPDGHIEIAAYCGHHIARYIGFAALDPPKIIGAVA